MAVIRTDHGRRSPWQNTGEFDAMKTFSLLFVIGWGAALAFGWMALVAPAGEPQVQRMVSFLLAATGFGVGLWAWVKIRRGF